MAAVSNTQGCTIVGVRHGHTFRTQERITIQGGGLNDGSAQLSPKGIEDAETLGARLAILYADQIQNDQVIIVSSPLGRCTKTAEKIAEAFARKKEELMGQHTTYTFQVSSGLKEIQHGKYEGMNCKLRDDTCNAWYDRYEKSQKAEGIVLPPNWRWLHHPLIENPAAIPPKEILYPNGADLEYGSTPETIQQANERGTEALREIGEAYQGKTVIAVSSGALLWSVAAKLDAAQREDESELPVYYGGKAGLLYPDPCDIMQFQCHPEKTLTFVKKETLVNTALKV